MKKTVHRDNVKITLFYSTSGDQVTVNKLRFEIEVKEAYSREEFEEELSESVIERLLEEIQ